MTSFFMRLALHSLLLFFYLSMDMLFYDHMWISCFHRTGNKSLLMYHDARSAFIVFLCHVVTLAEHVSCMPLSVVLTDDMLIIVGQGANPEDVWEILRARLYSLSVHVGPAL